MLPHTRSSAHVRTYTHTLYIYTHSLAHSRMHTHTRTHTHAHTYTRARTHTRTHTCTHIHARTHLRARPVQDAVKKVVRAGLPTDFYNIMLERPRSDPDGYDLLYVEAAFKVWAHMCVCACSYACMYVLVGI